MSLFSVQRLLANPDFLRDESRKIGTADAVAEVDSCHAIIEALREAHERNLRVTIQGARTGVAGGAVPFGGVVLSLARMNRILGMRQENGASFIRVQPGVRLADLRRHVRAPLFFALDPTETSASIGGMCATNASGACSYAYGPTRDHVHTLSVILASGERLELARNADTADYQRVKKILSQTSGWDGPADGVKNAAGFYWRDNMDPIDLFIGSGGQLGVIAEIELRLLPRPSVEWGLMCFFATESDALDVVAELRALPRHVAAIEFFDSGILTMLRHDVGRGGATWPQLDASWNCALYVELQATETLADIERITKNVLRGSWVAIEAIDLERLKKFRHAAPEGVNLRIAERKRNHPGLTKLGTDFSVPAEHLRDVMRMYREDLADAKLESVIFGHIGDSHLHVNVLPRDMDDYQRAWQLYQNWAQRVCAWRGSVSAEHGTGRLKSAFLRLMYGDSGIAKMESLRRAFDPDGMFAWA